MKTELAAKVCAGERASVAQALNLLDARSPGLGGQAQPLLDELARADAGDALRVGFTGPPGAGKSTLLDAFVAELRRRDRTVGVIAIDPSSVRTGGALLGDRYRAQRVAGDSGVFFRSMAARGRLGGLAAAARAAVHVLAAAYDWVIVETVGVGQSEDEAADLVDTLVYVVQPGAGDILQYMKAGLLELPDIFVVNKADLGLPAERAAQELRRGLAIGGLARQPRKPPVLLASALEGRGMAELLEAIEAHRTASDAAQRAARRKEGHLRFVLRELALRYGSHGLRAAGGAEGVAAHFAEHGGSEFAFVEQMAASIERALRSSAPAP